MGLASSSLVSTMAFSARWPGVNRVSLPPFMVLVEDKGVVHEERVKLSGIQSSLTVGDRECGLKVVFCAPQS
jgi:hypothetical protein